MPIFDYECPACGNVSEIRVNKYDDQPACPHCGYEKLRKLPAVFSAVNASPDTPCGGDCGHADGGHHCCNGCCHHH